MMQLPLISPDPPPQIAPIDPGWALGFAFTEGIGWVLVSRLLQHFGSLETAVAAPPDALQAVPGIGPVLSHRIRQIAPIDPGQFAAQGVSVAVWSEAAYPTPLSRLADRPLAVFWRGALPTRFDRAVAIVGTRQPTPESVYLAARWSAEFAERGWVIVSGLAYGTDQAAHLAAIHSNGISVAVLGSGVRHIYPPEHADLARRLMYRGAIFSEQHPDADPRRERLVYRNRLIAGLSRAVIIIEAGITSGALHAARHAQAQGRPVFAIPNSAGNRELLATFAHELPPIKQSQALIDGLMKTP